MSAPILNNRDLALQAAKYRSKQINLDITGTASAFLSSKNSLTIFPATIVLTANHSGSVFSTSAVYTWSYALSSAPNTWITLGTGKTWTLNNSDTWVKNAFVQYRCIISETLLDNAYGYYTVTYSSEPSEVNIVNLSRTNVLVTCDANGTPISFNNTDIGITVSRGTTNLAYSTNTTTPNSFTVSVATANLTTITATSTGTSWTMPGISAIALDGATAVFTIIVYDSSTVPVATTYTKTVVYNKVSNGTIGADGANLTPVANYDFAGASLPTNVTFLGTVATYESGTATAITNTVADQNLRLTNLSLVPGNSYIISMRVKLISGTWEGALFYTNAGHGDSYSYYKSITQPALGVWTTINVDMRSLTVGNTDYITGSNITGLRFDFINDVNASVAVDYISIGKYGVAEATKSITLSMYQWATSAPAYTGEFTYTWNTASISAFPSGWTGTAPTPPGTGYSLYQRNIIISDLISATTSTSNWNTSTVNIMGYRNDGTIGAQGDSYRIAYVVTTGVWSSPTAPTAAVSTAVAGSGDAAPTSTVTVGEISTLWSKTAPTVPLTDGQYMYQTDGILSSNTGNITWGTPYLSNLKVGSLSALSANLGSVGFAGGSLYSIDEGVDKTFSNAVPGIFLGNDGGTYKLKVGNADGSKQLAWDGTTLSANSLTLKDSDGNIYLQAGPNLSFSNRLPNTTGLPAENATVGAPTGTYVGAVLAEDVNSNITSAINNAILANTTAGVANSIATTANDTANTANATAGNALSTADSKLSKTSADILSGSIQLNAAKAIYIGSNSNGLYLGSNGMTAVNNNVPKFAISATGNAIFAGSLSGATGEFAGTLRAGVLDLSTFAGISYSYTSSNLTPGTWGQVYVPAGKNKMRASIIAGGGGGGGGSAQFDGQNSQGGGGGGYSQATFTVTPGALVQINLGPGGSGGVGTDDGANGGTSYIWYNSAYILLAYGGGGGGRAAPDTTSYPGGYGAAGTGTVDGYPFSSSTAGVRGGRILTGFLTFNQYGGAGGSSKYGSGGAGGFGFAYPGSNGTGYGGGGGGGGSIFSAINGGYNGGSGTSGYALIEFFDANSVVLQTDYQILKSALQRQSIAIS